MALSRFAVGLLKTPRALLPADAAALLPLPLPPLPLPALLEPAPSDLYAAMMAFFWRFSSAMRSAFFAPAASSACASRELVALRAAAMLLERGARAGALALRAFPGGNTGRLPTMFC